MQKLKNAKWSILALFIIVGLSFLSAYFEGYLNLILGAPSFLIFFAAVLVACIITALHMKTKFFIWLLVFGFFISVGNLYLFFKPSRKNAWLMFKFSSPYLFVLFAGMMADVWLR